MSNRSETFGRLLKGAINSIAAYEGKTAPAIEDELGEQIGVAGSTIQRYKAGYLPTEPRVVQILAEAAVRRGYLSRAWLTRFLQAVRYPSPDTLVSQLADALGAPAAPRDAALPSGMLAFLFTDIEGSTTLWEQHTAAMERALARHDQLLRQAIDAYGGQIFNTAGDAFHAVFTTVTHALDAALAAQRTLAAEAWGPIEPIRARMAVHVGMAQQRDGDYYGQPLNRVARLCAAGHGGQLLLSNAAQELSRDTLPKGTELRDLGEHRLKDLARPERIFQIIAPDLRSDFPPLRTLDRYTHNLPAQTTALIGREREVQAVCELIRREGMRLLTLTGPGGTGKTRLALQAAADLLDDFRDGVYFVPLAPIRDHTLVTAAIAQALGVKEQGDRPLVEQLKAYLRHKRLLLLLDNFEQVLASAPLVAELLAAAADLKVLVTSREALHLYGEHEYDVPSLGVPDPEHLPPIERLTQYEAVRLFIERAQAVRPDIVITADNAPAIAEICIRLDGLPLAIELAAARSKLFPPKALLARLDKRLNLLIDGPRDLPARQQTLRSAIAWSYDLLDAAEQAIFARLGVLVGGCSLEAAEGVLADDHAGGESEMTAYIPVNAVLDGLRSLIDKSLLKQEGGGDGLHFVMLETIREYALERLAASGEEAGLRQRHTIYYLSLAESAEPELYGPQQILWAERLDRDYDNLRAAINWCITSGSNEQAWRLAGALYRFWEMRGYFIEGWSCLASTLSLNGTDIPIEPRSAARAQALTNAAVLALWGGHDLALACRLLTESIAIQRELGNQLGIAHALVGFGNLERAQKNYNGSASFYEESLALFRANGDAHGCAVALLWLGQVARYQGQYEQAETLLAESLSHFQEIGDIQGQAMLLLVLGETARHQHDYTRASTLEKECLSLFRQTGAKAFVAMTELNLGFMAYHLGNPLQAATYFVGGLSFGWEYGTQGDIVLGLIGLGIVAGAQQPEQATRLFGATAKLLDGMDGDLDPLDRADYERGVASVRAQLDEEAFSAMWSAGRALPLEQTVAEALAVGQRWTSTPLLYR